MAKKIPVIKFHKDKYGDELLIDVVTLDMIRNSKTFAEVMRQVVLRNHAHYGRQGRC